MTTLGNHVELLSLQPMFPVAVSTFKICVHTICVCVYTGTGEAFVDVKVLGAGDDLLNSAAGRPRYVQLKSLR